MKGGYNLFNGKFYRENDPLFTGADLFRVKAGICESFRAEYNLVLFARENYDFLLDSLSAIGLPTPAEWNFPRFTGDVSRLLNKNHLYLAAKVIIHLIPAVSGTEYLLSAEELPVGFLPPRDGGLLIDFYDEGAKGSSSFSPYEPSSRGLWTAATLATHTLSRDNLLLLNNKGFACESIGGTFGYLHDRTAVFPARESQGYAPPILDIVRSCARECGHLIREKSEITREELLNADELFLISNCRGIEPVMGLYARRYYTTGTMAIATKLGETARGEHLSTHPADTDKL